jgi:hypothetical protein
LFRKIPEFYFDKILGAITDSEFLRILKFDDYGIIDDYYPALRQAGTLFHYVEEIR